MLFDEYGNKLCVKRIEFDPFKKEWSFAIRTDSPNGVVVYRRPRVVYLEKPAPPDSWEKLEEDLDRCIKGDGLCAYYSPSGRCSTCILDRKDPCSCNSIVLEDIKKRIRKLRGEN